jgi:hypothetical protein
VSIVRAALCLLLFLAAVVAPGYAVYSGWLEIPDRWNPWAPLAIKEPLHWLTRLKLSRLSKDAGLCLAVLEQANMRYAPVADQETGPGCGFTNAVRVEAMNAAVGEAFTLSCRSAVALALWEHHFVQPAARTRFGERVARLEHAGTYSCRNIYGRKDAPLSRHATADAIDVVGFTLEKGRRIRVERDWASGDADGLFLREVRDGACRVFDSVLGPEYNAAHRDHFHLDRGGWRACR